MVFRSPRPRSSERPSEEEDWLDEMVLRWTDVYKKSATTVVLLSVIQQQGPIAAGDALRAYQERTGWDVTERGLYRTLQRMTADGLVDMVEVGAARTGAKRKEYTISPLGRQFLKRVADELITLDVDTSG